MRYIFDDYTLDTRRYELRRAGEHIPLRPKVFQMLAYLLAHCDRVVSKDELFEHLWPEQFVGDATLNSCLMAVRKAVGDTGKAQHVIQTLPRRGYRFVAAVEVQDESPSATQSLPMPLSAEGAPGPQETCVPTPSDTAPDHVQSSSDSSVAEGEHKSVTILCCSVDEAATLAMRLGPEAMYRLMQALFKLAQGVIRRYEGSISQFTGDGFTALFGAQVAQEDHAQRAVLAALELRQQFHESSPVDEPSYGGSVSISMGLHTGSVVVGGLEHAPQRTYTAAGATTHIASRLQNLASPGALLISDATYRFVHAEVQADAWGTLDDPVIRRPIAVYTVRGVERQRPGRSGRAERPLSHFVGRERELSMLEEQLARVENGQGQVVGIVGELGIGKSRLLYEFRRRVIGKQVTFRAGRCLSYGSAIPYLPVRDMLRQICGVTDMAPAEFITAKVQKFVQQAGMRPEEWTPYLLQLLGVREGTESLAVLSPETIRRQTFTALRQLCLTYSQHRPLIVAIEDLHWIDKTSEDFFTSLVESLVGAAVLFLSTYRSGYRPPWLEKSYATQLALQPLVHRESLRMVQTRFQDTHVPEELLQELLVKAEGNPFFIEELAQAVVGINSAQMIGAVPDSIQNLLMARIDRLPDAEKQLLQIASILGREFPLKLLQMIWKGSEALDTHLLELKRLEFLYEQAGAAEPVYLFKHALTQEVAYASMLLARQQALHGAVGRALETLYADHLDDVLDRLAYHYAKSKDADKAVTYLTRLADKAARNYAHAEAVAALQDALGHVEQLPVDEQTHRCLDILLRQAFSLSILGRFQEILDLLLPQQELLDHLQEPILTGPYHFRLGMTYTYLGAYAQAAQHARRAIEAAQQCQDTTTLGMAHYTLAFVSYSSGRFLQGVEHSQQAIAFLRTTEERQWLGLSHWIMGLNASFLGDFAAALTASARARDVGEAIGEPRLQCMADGVSGWVYTMQGEWDTGLAMCQRSLDRSPDPVNTALALAFLGTAHLEKQDAVQAIPLLEQAVQRFSQFQFQQGEGRCMPLLGEALLLDGRHEQALHWARQGLEISREAKYLYGVGLAHRALGRIAQANGDHIEAAHHLSEALQTFTDIQARYEVARTYLTLAELAHAQEDRDALTTNLTEAYALFQTLQLPKCIGRTQQLANTFEVALPAETVR